MIVTAAAGRRRKSTRVDDAMLSELSVSDDFFSKNKISALSRECVSGRSPDLGHRFKFYSAIPFVSSVKWTN